MNRLPSFHLSLLSKAYKDKSVRKWLSNHGYTYETLHILAKKLSEDPEKYRELFYLIEEST